METQYLMFHAEINEKSANQFLAAIVDALNDNSVGDIYVGFSSPGGTVSYGVAMHYAIKASAKPITMHALGAVDSIGISAFCAGHKRKAAAGSRFYFHPVTRWVNAGNYNKQQIHDATEIIDSDEGRLTGLWKSHLQIGDAEISALFQGEQAHGCDWALASGLIESVSDFHIPAASSGRIKNVLA